MTIMGHSPGRGMEMPYRYSTFELADLGQAVGMLEGWLMGIMAERKEEDGKKD